MTKTQDQRQKHKQERLRWAGKLPNGKKKNEPLETKENTIVEGWRGKKGFCLSSE